MIEIEEILTRFSWQRKFARIPSKEWCNFAVVTPDGRLDPRDKLWCTSTPRDGQPFHRSFQTRFALRNKVKICYLASDASIAFSETNPILREDNQLTLNKIMHSENPIPRRLSRSFRLAPGIPLLELRNSDVPFLTALEAHHIIADRSHFYKDVVAGRDASCYPITQAIARMAFRKDFFGIVYTSARQPKDWNVSSPDCVVLFRDALNDAA